MTLRAGLDWDVRHCNKRTVLALLGGSAGQMCQNALAVDIKSAEVVRSEMATTISSVPQDREQGDM